jgi:hypothetical protein
MTITMPRIPPQSIVEDELLRLLKDRESAMRMSTVYTILADHFGLTKSERYGSPCDPKGSSWEYVVRNARRCLKERGWLHSPKAGYWELTGAGRERANGTMVLMANKSAVG